MIAVLTLLVIVVMSLLVVRVATIALTQTGISKDLARFEARSAFTGAGYTTMQSEQIVGHPVRRRIVMMLMLLGSAGHVTVISSLILSFVGRHGDAITGRIGFRLAALFMGLTVLWMVGHSDWCDKQITRAIKWALVRFAHLDLIDYVGLLQLAGEYQVAELLVTEQSWLANNSLAELRLTDENLLVLGVHRPDGQYVGTPRRDYVLQANDNVIIYGPKSVIKNVDCRPSGEVGDRAHIESVQRQSAESDGASVGAAESHGEAAANDSQTPKQK